MLCFALWFFCGLQILIINFFFFPLFFAPSPLLFFLFSIPPLFLFYFSICGLIFFVSYHFIPLMVVVSRLTWLFNSSWDCLVPPMFAHLFLWLFSSLPMALVNSSYGYLAFFISFLALSMILFDSFHGSLTPLISI